MPTATRPPPRAANGTPPHEAVAGELIDLVSGLRRSVRRRVRRDWSQPHLTPSEVELLVLVGDRPGLRVQDAAAAIGVAANTVSTLVGRLIARGLLARRPDEDDARAARLMLTDAAVRRRAEWRDRRREMMSAAMRGLSSDEVAAISSALPSLRRLLDSLEDL